jgi:hypothetical protein
MVLPPAHIPLRSRRHPLQPVALKCLRDRNDRARQFLSRELEATRPSFTGHCNIERSLQQREKRTEIVNPRDNSASQSRKRRNRSDRGLLLRVALDVAREVRELRREREGQENKRPAKEQQDSAPIFLPKPHERNVPESKKTECPRLLLCVLGCPLFTHAHRILLVLLPMRCDIVCQWVVLQ